MKDETVADLMALLDANGGEMVYQGFHVHRVTDIEAFVIEIPSDRGQGSAGASDSEDPH